jgi:hypothetical protein
MSEESTPSELMELQKRLTEAANRRDLDALMAFYEPDAVYDMSPIGMGVFEGQAAARGFIEDWWGSYEEFEFEAEETLDLGNGVGFRVLIQKGRPVGSSGEVQLRYAAVRGPCCRRTPRAGTGVGDVAGERGSDPAGLRALECCHGRW